MALGKQEFPIIFGGGIDTKTDPKLVVPGKLLSLENGVFKKGGRINKRFGFDILSTLVENVVETVDDGQALGIFNDELNLYTGTKLYTYADSVGKWVYKGNTTSAVVSGKTVLTTDITQKNPSVAYNQGLSCYAWENSTGGLSYSVVDQATGASIITNATLATTNAPQRPKVVAFGNYFVIFYSTFTTSSLYYRAIDIATPSTIGTAMILSIDMSATPTYDATVVGTNLVYAYGTNSGTIKSRYLDPSFVIFGGLTVTASPVTMTVFPDASLNTWVVFNDGSKVAYYILDPTLTAAVLTTTTLETTALVVKAITGVTIGTTATVLYEINATETYNHYVRYATGTLTGTTTAAADYRRSVGLAGKAFVLDGIVLVPTLHQSDLQSTYFILSDSSRNFVSAKVSPTLGGELVDNGLLSEVPTISARKYLFVSGIKGRLQSINGDLYSPIGINSSVLDFTSESKFQNVQLGELYITGGILQSYDGGGRGRTGGQVNAVVEDGFHLFPEDLTSSTSTTGGSMSGGTYLYRAVFQWTDNLGQSHRSAPSVAITQVVPNGTTTNRVEVVIPTLRITAKTVQIELYRTESLGQTFYRTSVQSLATQNSTSNDTLTIIDTRTDASLVSGEILYTTGGVIENIAAPACSLITTFKNRVFISGLEDPLAFWYSKERIAGVPVEFSDSFIGRVDSRGGDITALGAMDNYVVFFKQTSIFAMSGNGPTETGEQSDYTSPTLITTDVGCDNPNSVAITPDGLMFKSAKGIYLLNRSLQASYIGAEVEEYNSKLITSSQLLSEENQIRFTTDDDTCLVYDYFFKQWSTFTNHTAEDSAIWQKKFVFLRANGQVCVENQNFKDGASAIALSLTTSWMSLGSLQGFQRIYRTIILGDYKSPHKLVFEIGYDFSPDFQQTALIDIDSSFATKPYELKTHMTRQKCTSLRYRITDNQASIDPENYGESFNIASLAVEVGVKPTLRKYAASNSFSTSG